MKVDLSDVPESTQLAVVRLVELSRQSRTGQVRVNLNEGGVTEFQDPPANKDALKRLARRESGGRGT